MPTKEQKKVYQRTYRKKHKEQLLEYNDAYQRNHRELYANSSRAWYKRNREKVCAQKKEEHIRNRQIVFDYYSKGGVKCANCGINDDEVLCIDHIVACGSRDRTGYRSNFYKWLIAKNLPPGFQVLCANCNMKKEKKRLRDEGKITNATITGTPKLF